MIGLSFFDDGFGEGLLPDLLHYIGKEYEPVIEDQLLKKQIDKHYRRPMHSRNDNFVLDKSSS